MKKSTINLLVGAILLIGMIALGIYAMSGSKSATETECPPPPHPVNVPATAVWRGGCSGGYWITMEADSSNYYHFKVYRNKSGVLEIDALFTPATDSIPDLNMNNWREQSFAYQEGMDSAVYIVLYRDTTQLALRSVYPAYGGEVWKRIATAHSIP